MIGFNYLGNLGHLGNQMFQYASLRGIANNRGYSWCIPPKEYAGKNYPLGLLSKIYSCFNLSSCSNYSMIIGESLGESSYSFDENLFENCPDNVSLHGYFQSEKYFKHIESEIREDFKFKKEIFDECKGIFDSVLNDKEKAVSLHIRRGDYTKNPNHPIQSLDWYREAISIFDSDCEIVIFSDDSKWCKDQKLFSDDRFIVSEGNSAYHDMCLMTMLKNHIICNSTFSWWGSYLANSKKTVEPKNWFADTLSNYDTSDMYRKDWIVF